MPLKLEKYIVLVIKTSLMIVLFLPLLAVGTFYFPFIFPRDIAFRILSELAFILYLYLAMSNSAYRPKFNFLTKAITAFFSVLLVSSVFGVNFYASLWGDYERMGGLFHLAHVYLYFLVLINIFKTKNDWYRALTFSFLISLMASLIGLAQYLGLPIVSRLGGGARLSSSLGNASFFSAYLLFNIFFGLYLLWSRKFQFKFFFFSLVAFEIVVIVYELSLRWRFDRGFLIPLLSNNIFLIFLIVFNILAFLAYYPKIQKIFSYVFLISCLLFESFILFSTQTRGAVLGFYIGLALIAFLGTLTFKKSKQKLFALILLLIMVLSPVVIYLNRDADFVKNQPTLMRLSTISSTDITTQSRLTAWRGSWQGWLDRPILGWGVENYKDAFNKYFPTEIYRDRGSQLWFDRAHNIIFDVGVTSGFVGLAVYLSIYLIAFWQIFKIYRKSHDFTIFIIAVLIISYFIQNLFVFDTLNTELMIFLIWGFIIFLIQEEKLSQDIKGKKSINERYALPPLVFLLVIFLIFTYLFNIKSAQANILISKQLSLINQVKYTSYNDDVVAMITKSISLSPIGRFEARQQLANYLMVLNKNTDINPKKLSELAQLTIGELKKSINEEPQNVRNHLYLATVYNSVYKLNKEYSQEAIKLLTGAISLSSTRPQIYSERCQAYMNLDLYNEAIADCKESLALSPNVMESHWNLFLAYILADQDQKAEEELIVTKDVGEKTGNPVTFDRLLNVYIQLKKWPKAIDLLQREVVKTTDNPLLHVKLAVAYKEVGDKAKARLEVQKAVELDPSLKSEGDIFLKLLEQ